MACNDDPSSFEIKRDAGGDITLSNTGTAITSTFELIPLNFDLCDDPAFLKMLDLVEKQAPAIFGQKLPPTKDAVGTDSFKYYVDITTTYMDLAPLTRAAQLECWREAILLLNLKSIDFPCLSSFDAMVFSIAISRGNDLIMKHMLSLPDVDINGRSPIGQSPLEAALEYQRYYFFQLLLSDH